MRAEGFQWVALGGQTRSWLDLQVVADVLRMSAREVYELRRSGDVMALSPPQSTERLGRACWHVGNRRVCG